MLTLIPVKLTDCFAAHSRYACSLRLVPFGTIGLQGLCFYANHQAERTYADLRLLLLQHGSKRTLESCGYARRTRYVHFYFEENA